MSTWAHSEPLAQRLERADRALSDLVDECGHLLPEHERAELVSALNILNGLLMVEAQLHAEACGVTTPAFS